MTQPLITFTIPCYNSAAYMEKCVNSLLPLGEEIEILLVNDGSKDNTYEVAKRLEEEHPNTVRAIHQENKGHGGAVNTGLAEAVGMHYKVVDSDDWLDSDSAKVVLDYCRQQAETDTSTDLVLANYVYEKEGTSSKEISYRALPKDKVFSWDEVGRFGLGEYILMHSAFYRTELLREAGLKLPEHCFYVDNIFVYVPLPSVKTIRYFDLPVYRYLIGREDQSVNEKVMLSRVDQQVRITREMIKATNTNADMSKPLKRYMESYLAMMMCICNVFLRMDGRDEKEQERKDIWDELKVHDNSLRRRIGRQPVCFMTGIPGKVGKAIGLAGYRLASKIFKFN